MSYYQVEPSYYANDKNLYGSGGDARVPVPGWGLLPHVAGPERIAVGAAPKPNFSFLSKPSAKADALRACLATGKKLGPCNTIVNDPAIPACVDTGRTLADCMAQAYDPKTDTCVSGGNTLAQCMDVDTSKKGFPWWGYIAIPVGIGTVLAVGSWYMGRKKP